MAGHVKAWEEAGRPSPHLTVLPAGTSDADLPPGRVLDKRHARLVITWRATLDGRGR
jgi:protein-L-isoaspartate(D-aspartate) O-methyltransferase